MVIVKVILKGLVLENSKITNVASIMCSPPKQSNDFLLLYDTEQFLSFLLQQLLKRCYCSVQINFIYFIKNKLDKSKFRIPKFSFSNQYLLLFLCAQFVSCFSTLYCSVNICLVRIKEFQCFTQKLSELDSLLSQCDIAAQILAMQLSFTKSASVSTHFGVFGDDSAKPLLKVWHSGKNTRLALPYTILFYHETSLNENNEPFFALSFVQIKCLSLRQKIRGGNSLKRFDPL